MNSPALVLIEVIKALEELGIRYVLVGSFASSMHGQYRSTADIDLLADLTADTIRPFIEAVQDNFYVDESVVRRAVSQGRSFNLIHFDSVFKVDIFVSKSDEFSQQQLERRQLRKFSPDFAQEVYVATAEDTVLAKLRWFRAGGEVSNTQWSDIVGILGAQGQNLDLQYLQKWAASLRVLDLLQKALAETGNGN